MSPLALRIIFGCDRLRFAWVRRRHAGRLRAAPDTSPNLRFAQLRLEPGSRLEIGPGFATERQPGNHIWLGARAVLALGERCWLRTEYGANRITVFEGARIDVGRGALINGAMLHAKSGIRIGSDCRIGFGVRILDADLHDLDTNTPERVQAVEIGDRVWIGADALVLRGVHIGDDTVVGAGSVVTRDLPARCLALGAPAKPVRDIGPRTGCS